MQNPPHNCKPAKFLGGKVTWEAFVLHTELELSEEAGIQKSSFNFILEPVTYHI